MPTMPNTFERVAFAPGVEVGIGPGYPVRHLVIVKGIQRAVTIVTDEGTFIRPLGWNASAKYDEVGNATLVDF